MSTFKIQDSDTAILILESHYYKWLEANKIERSLHYRETKQIYLKEQGFVLGTDFLNDGDLSTLCFIEQAYARNFYKHNPITA